MIARPSEAYPLPAKFAVTHYGTGIAVYHLSASGRVYFARWFDCPWYDGCLRFVGGTRWHSWSCLHCERYAAARFDVPDNFVQFEPSPTWVEEEEVDKRGRNWLRSAISAEEEEKQHAAQKRFRAKAKARKKRAA
jgi:hypothetical protein